MAITDVIVDTLPAGVFVSSNGAVRIEDGTGIGYEIIRIQRAVVRLSNNIDIYYETGKQSGITYAGNVGVSGSLTRTFISFADWRLLFGETGTFTSEVSLNTQLSRASVAIGEQSPTHHYQPVGQGRVIELELDRFLIRGFKVVMIVRDPVFVGNTFTIDSNMVVGQGPLDFVAKGIDITFKDA